jgi:membrane protein implicated in regulation of membrane protease activity
MPDWGWWVLGAFVLLGIEALSLDLVFASLAVGAVAGAVAAAAGLPLMGQVFVAGGVAILSLLLLRPLGLRMLKTEGTTTNVQALIGAGALVVERVDARSGRVKIGGEIWSARASRAGTAFGAGEDLQVISIDGATAVVDRPAQPTPGTTEGEH